MDRTKKIYIMFVPCLVAMVAGASAFCQDSVQAVTKPSYEGNLTFSMPGRVAEVKAVIGQRVRSGDLLAKLDDSAELIRLEQLKVQSQSETRVDAAAARLEQNKSDLTKLQEAAKRGAASKREVEHAELETTIGALSLDLARFEHNLDQMKYQEMKAQLERMKLFSPVDGVVEDVQIKIGENVHTQEREKVIRIIAIDPLWIDVPVPSVRVGDLGIGTSVSIGFEDNSRATGKITFIGSKEDVATETVTARVELGNPEGRRAGQKVTVFLPENKD